MADSSLDDFFAKKDKNKRSKKKITTDEIAKKLEDGKRMERGRKVKDKTNATVLNTNITEQEDEEWNDFEEEREKDYSGLRIQTLSIKDREEELREQQLQELEEDNKKESVLGPWKVTTGADNEGEAHKSNEDIANNANESTTIVTPTATTGAQNPQSKYVPPHLRNQPPPGTTGPLTPISMGRKSKSGAPKIADIVEFPSLGTTNESNEDNKGFQTVRYGNTRETTDRSSTHVTLDNKYNLLTNSTKELQNSD